MDRSTRYGLVFAIAAGACTFCAIGLAGLALGAENLARSATFCPARSLNAALYQLANLIDGRLTANKDIRRCESCWAGDATSLLGNPLDLVVAFGKPRVIDRIVVTTCRLKNQPRLTDFDVYGWAGTDWDGHKLLAAVRRSRQLRMECRFEPVETSKLCIRLLDNARPTHNFPRISELEIYEAQGPARRRLAPGGLPKPLAELSTLDALQVELARLRKLASSGKASAQCLRRLELVEQKLAARREAAGSTGKGRSCSPRACPIGRLPSAKPWPSTCFRRPHVPQDPHVSVYLHLRQLPACDPERPGRLTGSGPRIQESPHRGF